MKRPAAPGARVRIRPIDPASKEEIALVAARMRATLVEVLGRRRGTALYTPAWLRRRVRFHLDPKKSVGQVFLSESADGLITGHCIVRVERDDAGKKFGLFSTTYVDPARRRRGIADALLRRGERWMRDRRLARAATDTSGANAKLINLYKNHGYRVVFRTSEMIRLAKRLRPLR